METDFASHLDFQLKVIKNTYRNWLECKSSWIIFFLCETFITLCKRRRLYNTKLSKLGLRRVFAAFKFQQSNASYILKRFSFIKSHLLDKRIRKLFFKILNQIFWLSHLNIYRNFKWCVQFGLLLLDKKLQKYWFINLMTFMIFKIECFRGPGPNSGWQIRHSSTMGRPWPILPAVCWSDCWDVSATLFSLSVSTETASGSGFQPLVLAVWRFRSPRTRPSSVSQGVGQLLGCCHGA